MKKKIVVPTDLTPTADQAIRQALFIARKAEAKLVLLHILDNKSPSAAETEEKLNQKATEIWEQEGLACEIIQKQGAVFDLIPSMTREKDWDLMVIGSHGLKGIRQMLMGPDILKLAAKIAIPVMVVQEKSILTEDLKRIVLPVSSHESFQPAIDAMIFFAGIFNVEVHLYSIEKAGFEWPKQLLLNIDETIKQFDARGVRHKRIKEDQTSYSMGYAKQTMKYADSVHADFVCVMSVPSKEYYFFAQADKETMLLNEFNIPVLFVGGGF